MRTRSGSCWMCTTVEGLLASIILTVPFCMMLVHGTDGTSYLPLREKHHHLLSKLSYYEVVRPHRSTDNGDFVTNDLSTTHEENEDIFRSAHRTRVDSNRPRFSRSSDDIQQRQPTQNFHFRVDAFGVSLVLNVTRNRYLVSPELRVERHNEDGTIDRFRPDTLCFYSGSVAGQPNSSVAISNCNGLSGFIQAGSEEYFIEPLEPSAGRPRINASLGHLHIMYRTRDLKMESTELETDFKIKLERRVQAETSGPLPDDDVDDRDSPRSRRSADSDGRQYIVETILAADHSMVTFHGADELPRYLLNMLNIVNKVYRHHTMTVDIQFIAKKIVLINAKTSKTLIVENRYKRSLTNVWAWASSLTPDGQLYGVADYVSFLTQLDFGPAGFAPLSTMCDSYWSSSLTRDQGLLSGFVMAHEAGHVLGLEHDGYGNSCVVDTYARSIMNSLVMAMYGDYYWSNCSAEVLQTKIQHYHCLKNVAVDTSGLMEIDGFPGERYSTDQQCRYTFGGSSHQCGSPDDYYTCDIRCTEGTERDTCHEYYLPALDGTGCGAVNQWCMDGVCVNKPPARNGKWSKWSDWSECSQDCDVGARTRYRHCDNPRPAHGGKDCKGKSVQFKVCNTQPCAVWVDRRAEQCKDRLSTVLVNGKHYEWVPFEDHNETSLCRLVCMSAKTLDILATPYMVTDGSPCTYEDHHSICVGGECKKLGCNKRVGSSAEDDVCGICGGDGSYCTLISKVFTATPTKKYQRVDVLPAGAYNIEVKEQSTTNHFLALRRSSDKTYILNGGRRRRGWPEFIAAGARFDYTKKNDQLTSKGPLHQDLDVLVYWTKDSNPINITYSYYMRDAASSTTIAPNGQP
ncbi:A disintegrin and metalloproteinase with thrombospondin motifs 3-like [Patiria miniata]|uniref:Peptidase M12B domain-containing protein n=1 Tax=Patiria miniata TaxID=46514 RepID=A0A914ADR2_PATMI|nr:A disintegrin and metalloproteinase with thrombospondin motifs 3-like [Patiria miniata]